MKGDKYTFTVAGKELTGDDASFLSEEFQGKNSKKEDDAIEDLVLPKNAVAVGESWTPDIAAVAKDFTKAANMDIDAAKSTSSGKLLKAYKKDSKQFGVFEIELNLALTKIAAGPTPIELNPGSMAKVTFKFDGCIDGSVKTGTMEMNLDMQMVGALKTPEGIEVKIDAKMKKSASKALVDLTATK